MAVLSPVARAQNKFLMEGGGYEMPLLKMREAGTIALDYEYHEYPKVICIPHGTEQIDRQTETCNKGIYVNWVETREKYEDIVVNSEEEEERVLSGGMTSAQLEDERQGLVSRCHTMGISVDPAWSAVRLRRLLGDALDAPAPGDEMGALKVKLAHLEEIAALKAKIAALEAAPDEPPIEELSHGKRGKVAA